MAYLSRDRRSIVIERSIREHEETVRTALTVGGYAWKEESFFSGFWAQRFIIERPIGKGAQAKINFLFEL